MAKTGLLPGISYRFRNIDLITQALTHRSFGTGHNERLEFLGDSILNCIIAAELYKKFPGHSEGDLSRLRAGLVNEATLAVLAEQLDLGSSLRLGDGEIKSGGQQRPSILSDTLEAVIGAVFLDGGFESAQGAVNEVFKTALGELNPHGADKDNKTQLQEWLQGRHLALPRYTVTAVRGEAHEQRFEVECAIVELGIRCTGQGTSRRRAEQDAARQVYAIASSA